MRLILKTGQKPVQPAFLRAEKAKPLNLLNARISFILPKGV